MNVTIRCKQCDYVLMDAVVYVPDQMFHTCSTGEIREFVRSHVHVDGCDEFEFLNIEVDSNNINGNIVERPKEAVSKSSTGGDEVCHDNMENFTELFKWTCHHSGVIM